MTMTSRTEWSATGGRQIGEREWPTGVLTRVPYWVYQDAEFMPPSSSGSIEGPVWNYLCLEAEIAKAR